MDIQQPEQQEERYSVLFSTYEPFAALQFGGYYLAFVADPVTAIGRFSYNVLAIFKSKEELLAYWMEEANKVEAFKRQAQKAIAVPRLIGPGKRHEA